MNYCVDYNKKAMTMSFIKNFYVLILVISLQIIIVHNNDANGMYYLYI